MSHLTHLVLGFNRLGAKQIAKLAARRDVFASLESLDLSGNTLGRSGSKALAALNMPRLKRLDLHMGKLGDSGLADLLEASWLPQLEQLHLADNGLTAASLQLLNEHPSVQSVTRVQLWDDFGGAASTMTLTGALAAWQPDAHDTQLFNLRHCLPLDFEAGKPAAPR